MIVRTAAAIAAFATATAAMAGERYATPSDPQWQAECSSCHVAYPPRLLPAESWRIVMAGLGRHYGADASVEPQTAAGIERFLAANAGRKRAPAGNEPRITQTAWFHKEHREVPAATWQSAAVKSASNCAACHRHADTGDYSERTLRVPGGRSRP